MDFHRPFGFLAVHRLSGLVLAAGWVTEPDTGVDPWEALLNRAAEGWAQQDRSGGARPGWPG
ncbi:hypothetical protein [Kitasatospora sp. NPDC094011]|uniref:hypothetical protein n=1 Tax=Kitasatospora sp. NPDC094011 TaxID=3364090 RepID=UPI00381944E2